MQGTLDAVDATVPQPTQCVQVGVTTPTLFGTFNDRESLPPIDPHVAQIFL